MREWGKGYGGGLSTDHGGGLRLRMGNYGARECVEMVEALTLKCQYAVGA
jgi:hypothetical protein